MVRQIPAKILCMLLVCTTLLFTMCPLWARGRDKPFNESLTLAGSRTPYIPEEGVMQYQYEGMLVEKETGNVIQAGGTVETAGELSQGVTYDSSSGLLRVTAEAVEGTIIQFKVSPPKGMVSLNPVYVDIVLGKNLLENGSFEEFPIGRNWGKQTVVSEPGTGRMLRLKADWQDEDGYYAQLAPEDTISMEAGKLYVLRGRVKTAESSVNSYAVGKNTVLEENGRLTVSVNNISGNQWVDFFSVFRPQNSGIYGLSILLRTSEQRELFLDALTLSIEEPKASSIQIDAPIGFNTPKGQTLSLPVSARVLDQEGNGMPEEEVELSLSPENQGISLNIQNGTIEALPNAIGGKYTIRAQSASTPEIKAQYEFTVNSNGIINEGFDQQPIGVGWTVLPPGDLTIRKDFGDEVSPDFSSFARLRLNSTAAILMSNSYVSFEKGKSYVFSFTGKKKSPDDETVMTVFIDDASSDNFDDNVLAAYFTLSDKWDTYQAIFTPLKTIIGNPLIAISAQTEEQTVYLDSFKMDAPFVMAQDVQIIGNPFVGESITGSYRFVNNFGSRDSSVFKWMVADQPDGEKEQIGIVNEKELELTEEMLGRYVFLEVTPISTTAGLVGEVVYSPPVFVIQSGGSGGEEPQDGGLGATKPPVPTAVPVLPPAQIEPSRTNPTLYDIEGHWAQKEITEMVDKGIAVGTSETEFAPDRTVTRAEFSAFLFRALRLPEVPSNGQFYDVSPEAWYAPIVQSVFHYDIAQGISDHLFAPNAEITREQMVAMVMRAYRKAGGKKLPSRDLPFTDRWKVSSYAVGDSKAAFGGGIISGYPDGAFRPQEKSTRAQALVIIYRMMQLLEEGGFQ